MRKLLKKSLLFDVIISLILAVAFLFGRFVMGNQYEQSYTAAILDKLQIAQSIEESKIILVGNSNVAFGFDSELIEQEFGMPVVNLGLHGGLGNYFHENMCKAVVKEGDIVVLCHSNYNDDGTITKKDTAWVTAEWHSEIWALIDSCDYEGMLKSYPRYWLYCLEKYVTHKSNIETDKLYNRANFNGYGDILNRYGENSYVFGKGSVVVPAVSDICVNRINELNDFIESKGAMLVIAGYPIGDGEYTPSKEEFVKFQEKLEENMNCEIISDFTDYFIPYKYFYNTNLHLDAKGAEIRTKLLIKDLKDWMSKEQNR